MSEICKECEHCRPIGRWCGLTEGSGAVAVCWVWAWVANEDTDPTGQPEIEAAQWKCAYRKTAGLLHDLETTDATIAVQEREEARDQVNALLSERDKLLESLEKQVAQTLKWEASYRRAHEAEHALRDIKKRIQSVPDA